MKLLLCNLVFSLFVSSCGNTNNLSTPVEDGAKLSQEVFNGLWVGSIEGGRPHFKGTPLVTLSLAQMDTLVNGQMSTSDSAFFVVQIEKGVATDTTLWFEAVQTNIYTGARVKFMCKFEGDSIVGTWNHNDGLHTGRWSAAK